MNRSHAPGRIVLVVGPSGAGKDTLINLARAHFSDTDTVVFPRRLVTRETNPSGGSRHLHAGRILRRGGGAGALAASLAGARPLLRAATLDAG